MRAHISSAASRPLALLYNLDSCGTLHALLRAMGVAARGIAPAELSQSVGALAGLGGKTAPPYTGPAPEQPMLIFHAFAPAQLDGLLDAMRAGGVRVPYKAVLTPHNQKWSALALLEELKQEHAALHGGKEEDTL